MARIYEFKVGDHDFPESSNEYLKIELEISSGVLWPINETMKCMRHEVSSQDYIDAKGDTE